MLTCFHAKARLRTAAVLVFAIIIGACATSPTGRKQLQFFPEEQMREMGAAAFTKMQQETPSVDPQSPAVRYVQCVTDAITAVTDTDTQWDVKVFKGDEVNAFALPGGHIGVYTGLLNVAKNDAQLAAVIGHEIGHVIADHPNSRLSTQYAAQAGLQLTRALLDGQSSESNMIMSLLGVGAQVGIILPFSRAQETEADELGLKYMARAGFDPRASVDLWQNMAQAGGGSPPEFLSTHPSHDTRIDTLQNNMDEALQLYQQASAQGRTPECGRA